MSKNPWIAAALGTLLACALIATSWAQDQPPAQAPKQETGAETPAAPAEVKKDSSPNPVQQIMDVTKDAATKQLLKARDWESSRVFGIYIGKNRTPIPLTPHQRKEIYLHQTLTTPEAYIKRMFGTGFDEARGNPRQWDDGLAGLGERFASHEGQFITSNTLAALGNYKLGYEVRYDQCKCQGAGPRIRHAFMRNLLTYDRTEEHLRPQWALYGGAFAGGMIASTWKPGSQNVWKDGAFGMVGQLGYGTLLNFLTEFAHEINRKQGVK